MIVGLGPAYIRWLQTATGRGTTEAAGSYVYDRVSYLYK